MIKKFSPSPSISQRRGIRSRSHATSLSRRRIDEIKISKQHERSDQFWSREKFFAGSETYRATQFLIESTVFDENYFSARNISPSRKALETEPHVSILSTRLVPVFGSMIFFLSTVTTCISVRSTVRGRDHSVETNETRKEFLSNEKDLTQRKKVYGPRNASCIEKDLSLWKLCRDERDTEGILSNEKDLTQRKKVYGPRNASYIEKHM